jgi:hypothetical protein
MQGPALLVPPNVKFWAQTLQLTYPIARNYLKVHSYCVFVPLISGILAEIILVFINNYKYFLTISHRGTEHARDVRMRITSERISPRDGDTIRWVEGNTGCFNKN